MSNQSELDRLAASATTHCMTGCAIGEVLGLVISSAAGWGATASIGLAVVLAFRFGYSLTMLPLVSSGLTVPSATRLALAADTISISVMEIVDNAIMLVIPGAMESGPSSWLFWGSLLVALGVAWIAAFPVNRWLIAKGGGHARIHEHHHH